MYSAKEAAKITGLSTAFCYSTESHERNKKANDLSAERT